MTMVARRPQRVGFFAMFWREEKFPGVLYRMISERLISAEWAAVGSRAAAERNTEAGGPAVEAAGLGGAPAP